MAAAPADIPGDIRAVPSILMSTPTLWLAPLAVLVGGIVLLVPTLRDNNIGVLVAQLLVVPPPLIPSFLAGMLAPRASWLFGLLTGLFAGLFFAVYVLTAPASAAVPVTDDVRGQALLYAVVVSPLFGLATGAFAGFYRRFLRISGAGAPAAEADEAVEGVRREDRPAEARPLGPAPLRRPAAHRAPRASAASGAAHLCGVRGRAPLRRPACTRCMKTTHATEQALCPGPVLSRGA